MVEHLVANEDVASSSLVSRSNLKPQDHLGVFFFGQMIFSWLMAGWQSGYAAACKAVYAGSIPTPASIYARVVKFGRHKGLKIPRLNGHAGSSPAPGTNKINSELIRLSRDTILEFDK